MSPFIVALLAAPLLVYMWRNDPAIKAVETEITDLRLTMAINHAASEAGLNPVVEMQRMSESVMYPAVFPRGSDASGPHMPYCECGRCQQAWPAEERSRIIDGGAHAHTCECDECRVCVAIILGMRDGAKVLREERLKNGQQDL